MRGWWRVDRGLWLEKRVWRRTLGPICEVLQICRSVALHVSGGHQECPEQVTSGAMRESHHIFELLDVPELSLTGDFKPPLDRHTGAL